ncbi:CPLS1 [Symbiodinium necroappetens]|uniref:CPLS1 protein n=1 Tax=Symbiodinium necroappetens TaxID=1628268 RepID=A0A812TX29_9DINO|nr:CPLS1 [Symbiodinium necroappetens]|mmetsp:Transcript_8179/g.19513  ORF Transcript_8179/g.19513 Transcript_8179/m.19513 type:complete len:167 (+) Transcript_8179:41-541(+)|eukprot:CAMPEP_0181472900 /NCGR_PEP_ID=MMETSP1110-20121109/39844_1 /TAXON_ID=174948 /ORGANISM="Symbiodinium sp., Strain CCMP421" /LENGTH=166 /DNA_ID=CAMNT_0023597995 /DNA_START=38 /DNA_END=538 /DNA_ORIENTATION=+
MAAEAKFRASKRLRLWSLLSLIPLTMCVMEGLVAFASTSTQRGFGVIRRAQMQPDLPDAGIAVIEKVDRKTQMKEQFEKEKWWRVLLHNDDIHTFEYVTNCLVKVVQHLSRRKAYGITWEAHSSGKATVACVWKALAEQFCVKLQQDGLTVSIAPDSKFEGNKGGQ